MLARITNSPRAFYLLETVRGVLGKQKTWLERAATDASQSLLMKSLSVR